VDLEAWYHSVPMYGWETKRMALVQWWWGHNAVAFVFTVPIIAMIYYFLPKESGQAVYSYKLSLISFWGYVRYYGAGGHHLLWPTVPDWVQQWGPDPSINLHLGEVVSKWSYTGRWWIT